MKTDLKKVGIVGHVGLGKSVFEVVEPLKIQDRVTVIEDSGVGYYSQEMTTKEIMDKYQVPIETFDIKIGGAKYRRIRKENISPRYKALEDILQSNIYTPYVNEISRLGSSQSEKIPMPKVNIETEFMLIQCKKSKLTKRERDWVESQFLKLYERV